jgi:DUF1009 family protein
MNPICILAGRGVYPLELARSARAAGVRRVVAVGFHGETRRELARLVDEMRWVHVGSLRELLEAVKGLETGEAVMAGQIRPSNLFLTRLDKPMRELLAALPRRNADTIFGAVGAELLKIGVRLGHAGRYMESRMPSAGILSRRAPSPEEWADIRQGFELAKTSAALKAGQAVVIKRGTVIAVEAFEGTDRMILRAGKVGGADGVVVKVAQPDHDMRFDIPVAGMGTLRSLRRAKCRCLALEAGRGILLERERFLRGADALGLAVVFTPDGMEIQGHG